MGLGVSRERRAHGVGGDIAQRHRRHIPAVGSGDEGRDRVEVLPLGLHGVRRGFTGAAVGQEGGEPLRSHNLASVGLLSGVHQPVSNSWIAAVP